MPDQREFAKLSLVIKVSGTAISKYYPLVSLSVRHFLDQDSVAEITFADLTSEGGLFALSGGNDFLSETGLEILAGFGAGTEKSIFTGIIYKLSLNAGSSGFPSFVVHAICKTIYDSTARSAAPDFDSAAVLKLKYGSSLIDFNAELSRDSRSNGNVQLLTGKITFLGTAGVNPGDLLELEGLGPRFSRKVFVSSLSHSIVDQEWMITAYFG